MYKKDLLDIRRLIYKAGIEGGMAHLASSYSCVEILYSLFLNGVMNYDSKNPDWDERDRFILSKGHAGLALYATMMKAGYLTEDDFFTYLKKDAIIGGEPSMRDLKGVEASTGSLGHGLSVGMGMALGQKMNGLKSKTYVLLGDGECQEGSIWEAAMSASAYELDNLIAILDYNKIQKMDTVKNIMKISNWKERWESFGWDVIEIDGHDVDLLTKTFMIENKTKKPRIIIANTVKGKGISIMENNPNWHFKVPNKKEKKIFEKELLLEEN